MKFLKFFPVVLLSIIFLSSCQPDEVLSTQIDFDKPFSNKITSVVDGETVIENQKSLAAKWEQRILEEEGREVKFETFKIMEAENSNEGNAPKEYFLMAVSSDQTLKTAVQLTTDAGGFQLALGSVTCTGCTQGCNPQQNGSRWSCTSCWPNSDGGCKKTVKVDTFQP